MNNTRFGMTGEQDAYHALCKHFIYLRKQRHLAPFDWTAIDKLTGQRVAIEVKTIRREHGKLVHIENGAYRRKVDYCNATRRHGIVLVIIKNGNTQFYLARLDQHISNGKLVELK